MLKSLEEYSMILLTVALIFLIICRSFWVVSYQYRLCLPASHRTVRRDRHPSINLIGIGGIRLTLCAIILRLTITCLVLI